MLGVELQKWSKADVCLNERRKILKFKFLYLKPTIGRRPLVVGHWPSSILTRVTGTIVHRKGIAAHWGQMLKLIACGRSKRTSCAFRLISTWNTSWSFVLLCPPSTLKMNDGFNRWLSDPFLFVPPCSNNIGRQPSGYNWINKCARDGWRRIVD